MIHQHDNRYFRPDLLNLIGDGCSIEEAEMVFEDNCMHGLRHEKPQTIRTVGSGCQIISVFPQ